MVWWSILHGLAGEMVCGVVRMWSSPAFSLPEWLFHVWYGCRGWMVRIMD